MEGFVSGWFEPLISEGGTLWTVGNWGEVDKGLDPPLTTSDCPDQSALLHVKRSEQRKTFLFVFLVQGIVLELLTFVGIRRS